MIGQPQRDVNLGWDAARVAAEVAGCRESRQPSRVADVPYRGGRRSAPGFLSLTVSPMDGVDPEAAGILILGTDVTERKTLEAQLAQAQKLESIGQLAAGIAHEINTPIQYVSDLNRCIENTVTVARNEWKYVAEMVTELAPDLPPAPCYADELNQALLHVVVNAAHAIGDVVGDGGSGKGSISICTRQDGQWIEVAISDTGSGIPTDLQSRIFDPFFTTKEVGKGTGQELAIAHSVIVEKHDGSLTVASEPGRGATFTIRLPLEA